MRPYTTLLSFLSILVPVFAKTHSFTTGIARAAPLLFVSICTFLLNDLDDIDKDQINHPDRPLPRGEIKPTLVVIFYYISLAFALFTIRFGIDHSVASFLYYILLTLAVSYSYVVEYLPAFKASYVAATSTIPILILLAFFPADRVLCYAAAAFFLFGLGRELCKDLMDRRGDPPSVLHAIDSGRMAMMAIAMQASAVLLMATQITSLADLVICSVMTLLVISTGVLWFARRQYVGAMKVMKVAMYTGLYFLI